MKATKQYPNTHLNHRAKKTSRAATHIIRPAGAKAFKAAFKHTFGTKPLPEHYDAVRLGEVIA